MSQPLLTFEGVRGRRVSLSLKRPIASEGGPFDPGPVAPIELHTREGVIECSAWSLPGDVLRALVPWVLAELARTPSRG